MPTGAGVGVLVVHDIDFASCHSDHIIAMRDGHVTADGPPDEIMNGPTLRKVFDTDLQVHQLDGHLIGVYDT